MRYIYAVASYLAENELIIHHFELMLSPNNWSTLYIGLLFLSTFAKRKTIPDSRLTHMYYQKGVRVSTLYLKEVQVFEKVTFSTHLDLLPFKL